MGLLDKSAENLAAEIEEAEKHFSEIRGVDQISGIGSAIGGAIKDIIGDVIEEIPGNPPKLELLGKSVGKVIAFKILPAGETGFPKLEMSFTDRGLYFFNGQQIPGGTNATYQGFLDQSLVFYGQGNGMSVAVTNPSTNPPEKTFSTWYTEGVAKLDPSLTGEGIYRGSMLYRWAPGPFAVLNPMPAIFRLAINKFGFTFGAIWRWVQSDTSDGPGKTSCKNK